VEVVAMQALVVYESIYGNTRTVAEAVARGLAERLDVTLVEVGGAPTTVADDVGLLVVGGPTHAHGMSTPDTRSSAAKKAHGAPVSQRIGLREWLAGLGAPPPTAGFAAFDTRIKGPQRLWGSAARAADAELRRRGWPAAAPPESFLVHGPFGPVHDIVVAGEAERARRWGLDVAASAVAHAGPGGPAH
jgi:hypothetical protein